MIDKERLAGVDASATKVVDPGLRIHSWACYSY